VDALTVDNGIDEQRVAPTTAERQACLERLARLVTSSGADLGVRFDPVAERLTLVDGHGSIIPSDRALLLYVALVVHSEPRGAVALPVSTTRHAVELARRHGVEVIGTKLTASAIMRAAQQDGVVFAGAEGGGYVFPCLHPAYDGLVSFVKLLELLTAHGEDGTNVAELGIGTNEKAILTGELLEDEKILGTCHVAFGASAAIGGTVQVPIHIDVVVMRPEVSIDGRVVLRDGELVL
jgi:phosphomannomutase